MYHIVLHFPTDAETPVGVWWWSTALNKALSYYDRNYEDYYYKVSDTLSSMLTEATWNSWIRRQVDGEGITSAIQADIIEEEPISYLNFLRQDSNVERNREARVEASRS